MKITKELKKTIIGVIIGFPEQALDRRIIIMELNPVSETVSGIMLPKSMNKSELPVAVVVSVSDIPEQNNLNLKAGDIIRYHEGSALQLSWDTHSLVSIHSIDAVTKFRDSIYKIELFTGKKEKPIYTVERELAKGKRKKK